MQGDIMLGSHVIQGDIMLGSHVMQGDMLGSHVIRVS